MSVKPTVLIVEDEAILRLDVRMTLEAIGLTVVGETARGDKAVEMATAMKPDIILMDIRLEGPIDGIAAARLIREATSAKIIIMSAFDDPTQSQALAGAEYISKPFGKTDLEKLVKTLFPDR